MTRHALTSRTWRNQHHKCLAKPSNRFTAHPSAWNSYIRVYNHEVTGCVWFFYFYFFYSFLGQIYKLMKFDSYARFVRSPLYQNCMLASVEGRPLPDLKPQNKCVTPTSDRKVILFPSLMPFPCIPTS